MVLETFNYKVATAVAGAAGVMSGVAVVGERADAAGVDGTDEEGCRAASMARTAARPPVIIGMHVSSFSSGVGKSGFTRIYSTRQHIIVAHWI
jgi:hypothetical protein